MRKLAIIPSLNEAGSIESVIDGIRLHAPDFDALVVDDGSTDRTAAVARAAGAQVVRHPFNLGIGGAVQSGYQYALAHDYDVAVQIDGDGQHDPAQLPGLTHDLHMGGEADMVWGSRFLGDSGYRVPRPRRAGIRIFARTLSAILGQQITDPTSGFRATNRRGIELFARDYPHDYPEVEAILLAHAHRMRLREVSMPMRERTRGRSSITMRHSGYYMAKVGLALLVGLMRRRPLPSAGDDTRLGEVRKI